MLYDDFQTDVEDRARAAGARVRLAKQLTELEKQFYGSRWALAESMGLVACTKHAWALPSAALLLHACWRRRCVAGPLHRTHKPADVPSTLPVSTAAWPTTVPWRTWAATRRSTRCAGRARGSPAVWAWAIKYPGPPSLRAAFVVFRWRGGSGLVWHRTERCTCLAPHPPTLRPCTATSICWSPASRAPPRCWRATCSGARAGPCVVEG